MPCATRRRATGCWSRTTGCRWPRATISLGGERRPGELRRAVRAHGGGMCLGVVSSAQKVDLLHDLGVEAVIDRRQADYKFWSGRAHAGRVRVAPLRQGHPALRRRRAWHRLRTPGRQTTARSAFACTARIIVDLRRNLGLHDRVRQPAPLDEKRRRSRAHTSPTTRRLGRQTGREEDPRCSPRSHPLDQVGEAAYQSTTTCTRARSASSAWARPRHRRSGAAPARRRGPHHLVPQARAS